jgi:hypothetical protein
VQVQTSGAEGEFVYTDGIGQKVVVNKHSGNVTNNQTGGGCFEAGTKVTMADGSKKNIEEIKIGDTVKSYNIYSNTLENSVVEQTYVLNQPDDLVVLTFEDNTVLLTTMTHPFYTKNGWVSLYPNFNYRAYEDISMQLFEMMSVGQEFYKITDTGEISTTKLCRIQYRHGLDQNHKVYNLDVDTNNTFFTNSILGHNAKEKVLVNAGTPGTT